MTSRSAVETTLSSEARSGGWGGIDKIATRLLLLSFFFPQKMQGLIVMVAGLYFVVRTVRSKEPVAGSNYFQAFVISSFYLLYLLAVPLTPHEYRPFLSLLCQRKASLLLMPLVFAITAQSFRKLIVGELIYFVYGCFVACVIGNLDFVYHMWISKEPAHVLSHVTYRIMFETCTGIHPTYMGMFLAFSICITLLAGPFKGLAKYMVVYLLLIFLLALLAKSPIIALLLIFIHYAYINRRALYRYKIALLAFFAALVAACFFIPFIGQRLREVLQFAGVGKPGNVADNSVYVRKLIWNVDTDLLKHYWLTGIGPGRVLQVLHERYFFYSIANRFPVGYFDPHNEYFSEWLSFGLLGIVLFVVVLVLHFSKALRAKNYLYLYLLLILTVTFSTETLLSRQEGVLFYAIFTSLFFFCRRQPAI